MTLSIKYSALLLFFISLTSGYAASFGAPVFTNTLKGDIGVHDPVMIKQGSTYYIFYTGDFIPIKTSKDRITWKEAEPVFSTCPKWFKDYVSENDGKNCWAPDIAYHHGKYWLYYSVSTFGKRVSAIGLATTPTLDKSSADYTWTDEGMIIRSTTSNNYNCIDPNLFLDTDGKAWLSFGSWNSGIKLVEINPQTGKLMSATPTLFSIAARTSTSSGIEAPFIIKRADYYYLFVSWDVCCKGVESTYNMRIGRASSSNGSYRDVSNTALSSGGGTLLDNGDTRWVGPGHNGIFTENDTTFLINHAYDAQKNGSPTLMIRPLYWNTSGWPSLDSLEGKATGNVPAQKSLRHNHVASLQLVPVVTGDNLRGAAGNAPLFTFAGKKVAMPNNRQIAPGVYILRVRSNVR